MQGQWRYVDSGTAITVGATTTLNLSQTDPNQLIESRTDTSGNVTKYYLLRAGIPNVAVTGSVNTLIAGGIAKHMLNEIRTPVGKLQQF